MLGCLKVQGTGSSLIGADASPQMADSGRGLLGFDSASNKLGSSGLLFQVSLLFIGESEQESSKASGSIKFGFEVISLLFI